MGELVSFVGVSAGLICTPGPGTTLTVRNVLTGGRRHALVTVCGIVLGQAIWGTAAALGVATILRGSELTVTAVGSLGAVYLCVAGARSLRAAMLPIAPDLEFKASVDRRPHRAALRDGLASNLGNPKMLVVSTGILPQFAVGHANPTAWTLLLGLTFCAITMAWLSLCTALAFRLRAALSRPKAHRAFVGVTGALLLSLGLKLLLELV